MNLYSSKEWKSLRNQVLSEHNEVCYYCDGKATQVDHMFPLKQFPELALEKTNLVAVCRECNEAKGNGVNKLDNARLIAIIESFAAGKGNIEPLFYKGYVPLTRYDVSVKRRRGVAKKTWQQRRAKELSTEDKLF